MAPFRLKRRGRAIFTRRGHIAGQPRQVARKRAQDRAWFGDQRGYLSLDDRVAGQDGRLFAGNAWDLRAALGEVVPPAADAGEIGQQARVSVGANRQRRQRDLRPLHPRDQFLIAAIVRLAVGQQDDVLQRGVATGGGLEGRFQRRQDGGGTTCLDR